MRQNDDREFPSPSARKDDPGGGKGGGGGGGQGGGGGGGWNREGGGGGCQGGSFAFKRNSHRHPHIIPSLPRPVGRNRSGLAAPDHDACLRASSSGGGLPEPKAEAVCRHTLPGLTVREAAPRA